MDKIRLAIQDMLDKEGDGWSLTQYVVAMGLEKIKKDGSIESIAWYYAPDGQADWQTGGLLEEAAAMHENAEEIDD